MKKVTKKTTKLSRPRLNGGYDIGENKKSNIITGGKKFDKALEKFKQGN